MGRSDAEAGEAAGVCRQTISDWKNHDPIFQSALNIARNELVRETMIRYREKMATLTDAAFAGVSEAIKRGDAATARWWMDNIGINVIAKQIFQRTVDPDILPEELGAVLDSMAGERVDDFLRGKDPIQRLRFREAMKKKELESLKSEYRMGDDDNEL